MAKWKLVLTIICSFVAVALIVLAVLVYIPRTTELNYDMRGFIISPDKQITEEFTMTANGESEEYILNQWMRKNKHTENGILAERDNIRLDFDWDSTKIPESTMNREFHEHFRLPNTPYILGALYFYNSASIHSDAYSGMFNQETGAICMYADDLNAFIVGVSDQTADPVTVLESYLKIVKNPAEPSPTVNNSTAIAWDMSGTFVLSDSTTDAVNFTVNGYARDSQDGVDSLNITVAFPDNFRYSVTPPSPSLVSVNQKNNDLPHLMICSTSVYDKQTHSYVFTYFAFDLEKKYIAAMFEATPDCYLVASADTSVDYSQLREYFADFMESYGFDH